MCSHCRPFTCSPMFANGAWFSHHTPRGRRKIEVKILRVADLTDLDTFIIHHAFSFPGTVYRRDRVSSRHFLHTFIRFLTPLSSLVTFASTSPFPVARQTEPTAGDWCARLGGDIIGNLNDFNLAVWNPIGNSVNVTSNHLVSWIIGDTGIPPPILEL